MNGQINNRMKKIVFLSFLVFCIACSAFAQKNNDDGGVILSTDEGVITIGDSSSVVVGGEFDTAGYGSTPQQANETPADRSTVYTINNVPNPKVVNNTYVSDPDHFLKESTIAEINSLLASLETKTTDQVAVVVLNSIGEEVPKTFATALFNEWGIGIRGKDNGLLILMVMDVRRVEFETGYGTESMLPDAICKRLQLTYMIPEFKEGNYDKGLLEGVKATADILSNPENSAIAASLKASIAKEDADVRLGLVILAYIFYIIPVLIIYIIKRRKKTFKRNYAPESLSHATAISHGRWLLLYLLAPTLICIYMYNLFAGDSFLWSFVGTCYVFALLLVLEKRIRINRGLAKATAKEDYYEQYMAYKKSHANWWIAAVVFPFVFIFYLMYAQRQKNKLRNHPRNCQCGHTMHKLNEVDDNKHLTKSEELEEELKSVDYDVWLCDSCGTTDIFAFANSFSKYTTCRKCKAVTSYLHSDRTISAATYSSSGTGCKTYKCKNCSYEREETYTIPMLVESSSSSSSGSSSSSSFGGGSSGGGGAGSSW